MKSRKHNKKKKISPPKILSLNHVRFNEAATVAGFQVFGTAACAFWQIGAIFTFLPQGRLSSCHIFGMRKTLNSAQSFPAPANQMLSRIYPPQGINSKGTRIFPHAAHGTGHGIKTV